MKVFFVLSQAAAVMYFFNYFAVEALINDHCECKGHLLYFYPIIVLFPSSFTDKKKICCLFYNIAQALNDKMLGWDSNLIPIRCM